MRVCWTIGQPWCSALRVVRWSVLIFAKLHAARFSNVSIRILISYRKCQIIITLNKSKYNPICIFSKLQCKNHLKNFTSWRCSFRQFRWCSCFRATSSSGPDSGSCIVLFTSRCSGLCRWNWYRWFKLHFGQFFNFVCNTFKHQLIMENANCKSRHQFITW